MHILQLNNATAGGAGIVMLRLHRAFLRQGHDAHILAQRVTRPGTGITPISQQLGSSPGLARLGNFVRLKLDRALTLPALHTATRKIIRTRLFAQADVIQFHNLHSNYFNIHLLPEIAAQKPVVWTLHDMWAFTGHCAYAFDCPRWQTGCGACPLLTGTGRGLGYPPPTLFDRTRQVWRSKQSIYGSAPLHIVTPSVWLEKLVKESVLASAASIQCIPNGLNLQTFQPLPQREARRELNLPPHDRVILFVAHKGKSYRKGFPLLLQALERIPDTFAVTLLTIGETGRVPEQIEHFTRHDLGSLTSEHDLARAYSAADIFVTPTLADNQPLVVIEALACGTPVVAFNVGGLQEMVHHMETGYLARSKDVGDLARGIQTLLADDEHRAVMRHRCRELAEQEYRLDLQAQRYLDLYEKIAHIEPGT